MSELKAKHVVDVYDDYAEHPCEEHSQVYLKSEVDATIEELKAEHHKERHEYIEMVAQLKAKLVEQESDNRKLKSFIVLYDGKFIRAYNESEADKVIAHNKYKRCLAMRNMCRYAQYSYSYLMAYEGCKICTNDIDFRKYDKKYHFYLRWRKRWMELAKKFKDKEA